MRKDIEIPEVKDVYIGIVNSEEDPDQWIVYLINNGLEPIESCMLVSRGSHSDGRKTSTFRHAYKVIPALSNQKVELMIREVFNFKNEFLLTYFQNGKLYDKTFVAQANILKLQPTEKLPTTDFTGILLK
jgi:hypothetical protein